MVWKYLGLITNVRDTASNANNNAASTADGDEERGLAGHETQKSPAVAQDAPDISDFCGTFQLSVDEKRLRAKYL